MTLPSLHSPAASSSTRPVKVLLVDDNRLYREAFRRSLELHDVEVDEAEDSQDAFARMASGVQPDVVVTDLQMRSETEGLDLIRGLKSADPLLPVIMISAVGTFEEGAEARSLGAAAVLSKARIEEDLTRLVEVVQKCAETLRRDRQREEVIQSARTIASEEGNDATPSAALDSLRQILSDPDCHPYLKAEAWSLIGSLTERPASNDVTSASSSSALEEAQVRLRKELGNYDQMDNDSRESLAVAELLLTQGQGSAGGIDFSRNIGFSFCFSVENEAKVRLSKKLAKLLASEHTYELLGEMSTDGGQGLNVFFHQHLLLLLRGREMDFTIDNVRQTFRRIFEHRNRYKPDGLKALGIIVLTLGREYRWQNGRKTVQVANPLGLKGFPTDDQVLHFARLLVSLQHYRNPYIHPEISDLEKLSKIRATAIECLGMIGQIQ